MAGKSAEKWPAIGIDLGTTYSCVAVWQHDRVEIITNDLGNRTTPSCVAFTQTHRLIGEGAINQASINPTNTIFGKGKKRLEEESIGGKGKKRKEEESVGDNLCSPIPIMEPMDQQKLDNLKDVLYKYSTGNSLAQRGEYWSVTFWKCILDEYNESATSGYLRLQNYHDILNLANALYDDYYRTKDVTPDPKLEKIFKQCPTCNSRVISFALKPNDANIHHFTEADKTSLKRVFLEYATMSADQSIERQRGKYRSSVFWKAILNRYNIISRSCNKTIDDMIVAGRLLHHEFNKDKAMGKPLDGTLKTIFQRCPPCTGRIPVIPYVLRSYQNGLVAYSDGISRGRSQGISTGDASSSRGRSQGITSYSREESANNTSEDWRKKKFVSELYRLSGAELINPNEAGDAIVAFGEDMNSAVAMALWNSKSPASHYTDTVMQRVVRKALKEAAEAKAEAAAAKAAARAAAAANAKAKNKARMFCTQ